MQRRLYIDEAHVAQYIFCFAVFFLLLLSQQSTHVPDLHEPKHIGPPLSGLFCICLASNAHRRQIQNLNFKMRSYIKQIFKKQAPIFRQDGKLNVLFVFAKLSQSPILMGLVVIFL